MSSRFEYRLLETQAAQREWRAANTKLASNQIADLQTERSVSYVDSRLGEEPIGDQWQFELPTWDTGSRLGKESIAKASCGLRGLAQDSLQAGSTLDQGEVRQQESASDSSWPASWPLPNQHETNPFRGESSSGQRSHCVPTSGSENTDQHAEKNDQTFGSKGSRRYSRMLLDESIAQGGQPSPSKWHPTNPFRQASSTREPNHQKSQTSRVNDPSSQESTLVQENILNEIQHRLQRRDQENADSVGSRVREQALAERRRREQKHKREEILRMRDIQEQVRLAELLERRQIAAVERERAWEESAAIKRERETAEARRRQEEWDRTHRECAVCLESLDLKDLIELACGHWYCTKDLEGKQYEPRPHMCFTNETQRH